MKLLEITDSLKDLVMKFVREYNGPKGKEEWGETLEVCRYEPGSCSMVSHTLIDWLKKEGIKAETITGFDAINPKWATVIDDGQNAHTAVKVGDTVVDLTAKQFDRSLPVPRFTTVEKFKSEWKKVEA